MRKGLCSIEVMVFLLANHGENNKLFISCHFKGQDANRNWMYKSWAINFNSMVDCNDSAQLLLEVLVNEQFELKDKEDELTKINASSSRAPKAD